MYNRFTRKVATIGNVCVRRFLGIDMRGVFRGIGKIRRDVNASPSADLLVYALDSGLISQWAYDFASSTARKRCLSPKQRSIRAQINAGLLRSLSRRSRLGVVNQ